MQQKLALGFANKTISSGSGAALEVVAPQQRYIRNIIFLLKLVGRYNMLLCVEESMRFDADPVYHVGTDADQTFKTLDPDSEDP